MYWLILLRPYSPSRLSAWSDGITPCHQLHDDRGVDVRVHAQRRRSSSVPARRPRTGRAARRRVVLEKFVELRSVDARHRHGRQEPEDDQDPEDEQDPAPDVRRAEGVEQGFEHGGLGGLAGRGLASSGCSSSTTGSAVCRSAGRGSSLGLGLLGGRRGRRLCCVRFGFGRCGLRRRVRAGFGGRPQLRPSRPRPSASSASGASSAVGVDAERLARAVRDLEDRHAAAGRLRSSCGPTR